MCCLQHCLTIGIVIATYTPALIRALGPLLASCLRPPGWARFDCSGPLARSALGALLTLGGALTLVGLVAGVWALFPRKVFWTGCLLLADWGSLCSLISCALPGPWLCDYYHD